MVIIIIIHTGVGYTDNESAQHFLTLKNSSHIFLMLLNGVRTSGLWISSLTLYQLGHRATPVTCSCCGGVGGGPSTCR